MQSFGIREVSKFEIKNKVEITRTEKSIAIIGTIEPSKEKPATQTINGDKYKVFDCNFFKDKEKDIIVSGVPYSKFKEVNAFKLYYSNKKKLLIASISLDICTPFLKYLRESHPDLVNYIYVNFDFKKIVRNNALVDQVWFGTTDEHARTKGFNGNQVNKNREAMKAINDGKATYIKVSIDVISNKKTKKRIIGFSKKSGLVIIQKNDPSINTIKKELELLMDSFNTYSLFK